MSLVYIHCASFNLYENSSNVSDNLKCQNFATALKSMTNKPVFLKDVKHKMLTYRQRENSSLDDICYVAVCHQNIHTRDSKIHEASMGPTWVLSAPGGPHVGPMNLVIRDGLSDTHSKGSGFEWVTQYSLLNNVIDVKKNIRKTVYHYNDVIMSAMASQIISLTIVYSTVYSGEDQRKH